MKKKNRELPLRKNLNINGNVKKYYTIELNEYNAIMKFIRHICFPALKCKYDLV